MNLFLGADHRGYDVKEQLEAWLLDSLHTVHDLGNTEYTPTDDYTEYAHRVAQAVAADPTSRGILLCGNAEGVCIVANKSNGIRAGIAFSDEAVRGARNDDDLNILCIPAELTTLDAAKQMVTTFLETPFEGAPRQLRRLTHIQDIEDAS